MFLSRYFEKFIECFNDSTLSTLLFHKNSVLSWTVGHSPFYYNTQSSQKYIITYRVTISSNKWNIYSFNMTKSLTKILSSQLQQVHTCNLRKQGYITNTSLGLRVYWIGYNSSFDIFPLYYHK